MKKYSLTETTTGYIFKEILEPTDETKPNLKLDYSTLPGLQFLAKNMYYQYLDQSITCLEIVKEIDNKEFSLNTKISRLFVTQATNNNVAKYLCNVNTRLILANNLLDRRGIKTFSFKDNYKGLLQFNGFLEGTVDSCNSDLYKAFFNWCYADSLLKIDYKINTVDNRSEFVKFLKGRVAIPVRAWTQNANLKSDTHATILFYSQDKIFCVDTASKERNDRIFTEDEINKGILFNRQILHLEALA